MAKKNAAEILQEMIKMYPSRNAGRQIELVLEMYELNASQARAIEELENYPLYNAWKTFSENSCRAVKRAAIKRVKYLLEGMMKVAKNASDFAEIIRECGNRFPGIKDSAFNAGLVHASTTEHFLDLFDAVHGDEEYELKIFERQTAVIGRRIENG